MTIAAGFSSIEKGLVVCSDSQESTTTGFLKDNVKKVRLHLAGGGSVMFAGAGSPTLSQLLEQAIVGAIGEEASWDTDRNQSHVEKAVLDVYQVHIWPSGQPSQLAAVIGLVGGGTHRLLKTDQDSVVAVCPGYACVGIGAKSADRASRLFFPNGETSSCAVASFDQLVAAACYVVWTAKETVDGCGGATQLAGYDRIGGSIVPTNPLGPILPALEGAFTRIEGEYAMALRSLLCADNPHKETLDYFTGMVLAHIRPLDEWHKMVKDIMNKYRKDSSA